jgi:hypothetical protein
MSGASYATLNTIASGGGAPSHTLYCNGGGSCYYYDVGKGDGTAFTAVLQTIQQLSVGCQYNVPQPAGGIPDPNKVDVLYSPGGQPPAQKISKVNDATACGANGGWYYDNNANPKVIYLCPTTCNVVQADTAAKVDINLGCLGS